jgi:hypothetical protein
MIKEKLKSQQHRNKNKNVVKNKIILIEEHSTSTKRLKFIYSERFLDTCLKCNKQDKTII